jgi:dTDP-4-dehydrorhamnose 3,5-epimerase-like enzyme
MFIPDGYAHGFLVLSEKAIVSYMTSSVYNKDSDSALHYNSFGFDWPCDNPIVSEKDQQAIKFHDS